MGCTQVKTNVITDRLLRSWIRCRRKAWLDLHEQSKLRIWTAHRALQLDHQHKSFSALIDGKPARSKNAFKEGCAAINGIRLKYTNDSGLILESHPPLLQRINGRSKWGKYQYRPTIARQGRRITREHRLMLAFHGFILGKYQDSNVKQGLTVSHSTHGLEIDPINLNNQLYNKLQNSLSRLHKDLNLVIPPPITSDRKKCSLCSWRGLCNKVAISEGDLSEISGIGNKRREMLQKIGIKSLDDLADSNPLELTEELIKAGEKDKTIANQIIRQAKAQKHDYHEHINKDICLPEIIDSNGILIYDIESDPDEKHDFLHGFLRITKNKYGLLEINNAKYHPMLMLKNEGEIKSWERLKKKLDYYKDWPILHYGETESIAIYQLAKRQGVSEEELKNLKKRFIDIHSRLKNHWILPLNNYGLKSVAIWLGFRWNQSGADGAKALFWWRQWENAYSKQLKISSPLKKIFQYNRDDCIATWSVANWLIKNELD